MTNEHKLKFKFEYEVNGELKAEWSDFIRVSELDNEACPQKMFDAIFRCLQVLAKSDIKDRIKEQLPTGIITP